MDNLRLSVNLIPYYQDPLLGHSARIFIKDNIQTINDLENHIARVFHIERDFFLINQHHFLPPTEDIRILREDDTVFVIPRKKKTATGVKPCSIESTDLNKIVNTDLNTVVNTNLNNIVNTDLNTIVHTGLNNIVHTDLNTIVNTDLNTIVSTDLNNRVKKVEDKIKVKENGEDKMDVVIEEEPEITKIKIKKSKKRRNSIQSSEIIVDSEEIDHNEEGEKQSKKSKKKQKTETKIDNAEIEPENMFSPIIQQSKKTRKKRKCISPILFEKPLKCSNNEADGVEKNSKNRCFSRSFPHTPQNKDLEENQSKENHEENKNGENDKMEDIIKNNKELKRGVVKINKIEILDDNQYVFVSPKDCAIKKPPKTKEIEENKKETSEESSDLTKTAFDQNKNVSQQKIIEDSIDKEISLFEDSIDEETLKHENTKEARKRASSTINYDKTPRSRASFSRFGVGEVIKMLSQSGEKKLSDSINLEDSQIYNQDSSIWEDSSVCDFDSSATNNFVTKRRRVRTRKRKRANTSEVKNDAILSKSDAILINDAILSKNDAILSKSDAMLSNPFRPPKTISAPSTHIRFTDTDLTNNGELNTSENMDENQVTPEKVEIKSNTSPDNLKISATLNIIKNDSDKTKFVTSTPFHNVPVNFPRVTLHKISDLSENEIAQYPELVGVPKVNDLILFKKLKLSNNYTPQISNYILAEIKQLSSDTNKLTIKVIDGMKEFEDPNGIFSCLPKEDEEEECGVNRSIDLIQVVDRHALIDARILNRSTVQIRETIGFGMKK